MWDVLQSFGRHCSILLPEADQSAMPWFQKFEREVRRVLQINRYAWDTTRKSISNNFPLRLALEVNILQLRCPRNGEKYFQEWVAKKQRFSCPPKKTCSVRFKYYSTSFGRTSGQRRLERGYGFTVLSHVSRVHRGLQAPALPFSNDAQ